MAAAMMNKFKTSGLLAVGALLTLQSPVLADGYSPYGGHIPEDTGFADGMVFTIVAIATYGIGIGLIILSRLIKSKPA